MKNCIKYTLDVYGKTYVKRKLVMFRHSIFHLDNIFRTEFSEKMYYYLEGLYFTTNLNYL